MDLNQIVYFIRVVDGGSFTAAARALDVRKSTVSRKVAELEERLGVRLLHRTTRKLGLTEAGRTYYARCAELAASFERAEAEVSTFQQAPRGRVRITIPLNYGFIAPILRELLAAYPEVELELLSTDRMVDLVEEGFDVAIRVGHLADSSLVARRLGTARMSLMASPKLLAAQPPPKAPEGLAAVDCLLFSRDAQRGGWRLRRGRQEVTVAPRSRFVVNDFEMLHDAAVAGLGVALLPPAPCAADLREGRLVPVLEGWTGPEFTVSAVYPSARHLTPKVKTLVDLLAARMPRALGG
jgi:DNA-binding transcriptional LysR family regulator